MVEISPGQMSIRAVAKVLNVSASTIHRDLSSSARYAPDEQGNIRYGMVMGLDGKLRPSRRFNTAARDDLICQLYVDGHPMREIAKRADCSVGTVHRVIKRSTS